MDRPAEGRRYLHEDRGVAKAVRGRAQDNLEAPWWPPAVGKRDEGADGALRHSIRHRGAGSVALFAKLDELASEAESDGIAKRQQARVAILGFVMLLVKVANAA